MWTWAVLCGAAALGTLAVLLGYHLVGRIIEINTIRKLCNEGRVIDWNTALDRVHSGNGFLAINATTLPGRLWWVPQSVPKHELYDFVSGSGLLIAPVPRTVVPDQLRHENYATRVLTLDTEPFSD